MKDDLIRKGIELFTEHGYHGTGLKMILEAVNVPKGSFYNYFDSKEQFAAEIISSYSRTLRQKVDRYLGTSDEDPLSAIRSLYNMMVEELEKHGFQKGCLLGNLAGEISGMSPICQSAMKEAFYDWRKMLTDLIAKGQKDHLFRTDAEPEDLAEIIWIHWEGVILRMKIEGATGRARQSMDILLGTLLR